MVRGESSPFVAVTTYENHCVICWPKVSRDWRSCRSCASSDVEVASARAKSLCEWTDVVDGSTRSNKCVGRQTRNIEKTFGFSTFRVCPTQFFERVDPSTTSIHSPQKICFCATATDQPPTSARSHKYWRLFLCMTPLGGSNAFASDESGCSHPGTPHVS